MADELAALIERDRILDTIHELFIGTDDRDWARVASCLAPRVRFDMSSLGGGEPTVLAPEVIVAAWDAGLKPMQAVHHQIGNHRVRVHGTRAEAFCYGIATHYRPNPSGRDTRTFVGSYDFELEKDGGAWRITAFKFNLKYIDGNRDLEAS
jgi:hypothetical protein